MAERQDDDTSRLLVQNDPEVATAQSHRRVPTNVLVSPTPCIAQAFRASLHCCRAAAVSLSKALAALGLSTIVFTVAILLALAIFASKRPSIARRPGRPGPISRLEEWLTDLVMIKPRYKQHEQRWRRVGLRLRRAGMVSKQRRRAALTRGADEYEFGIAERRYCEWITYVFDRDVRPYGLRWDAERAPGEFAATPTETVGLIGKTMARSEPDLVGFSNMQVCSGLNYILYPYSGRVQCFGDADVPVELKIAAIRAMKRLYKDCFEPRCDSCLGHLSESKGLNTTAYMLWDESPLDHWARQAPATNAAVMEVFEYALGSPNDACVESALHGLGHSRLYSPELAEPLIDHFLATTEDADTSPSRLRPVRKELRSYARRARFSYVQ